MSDIKDDPEITVFENEYLTMKFSPECGIIYQTIHKPCTDEISKESIAFAYEIMKENGVAKWLIDNRKGGPHSPAVSEWAYQFWEEHLVETGWKYWAMVVPTDIVSAVSLLDPFKKMYDLGLRIAAFMETDKAFQWLNSWD